MAHEAISTSTSTMQRSIANHTMGPQTTWFGTVRSMVVAMLPHQCKQYGGTYRLPFTGAAADQLRRPMYAYDSGLYP